MANVDRSQRASPKAQEPRSRKRHSHPKQSAPSPQELYRTVCVRTCDGYFFPVSFSTTTDRFDDDAKACSARGDSEHQLYTLKLPDGTLEDALSTKGEPYSDLPNALRTGLSVLLRPGLLRLRASAL